VKIMAIITINPDKTISIDGKKTFPVKMTSICSTYSGQIRTCQENIDINNNALYTNLPGDTLFQTTLRQQLVENNMFFHKKAYQSSEPDADGLLFYWQPDEPTVGVDNYPITNTMTEAEILAILLSDYNRKNRDDPNHPVVLNHWTNMTKWLPYADIMAWDTYTFLIYQFKPWVSWQREDSIYAWEMQSWDAYFQGTELNQINKPVWTYIQAMGLDDLTWGGQALTPQEARCNTYTAITLDVKGIMFFAYLAMGDWTHAETVTGLYANLSLATYYNQLMGELRIFNDILVLPTIDYHWTYHNSTSVLFSKILTKTLTRWNKLQTNFNYILKQNGNTLYLIVVNKDTRPISDVGITIQGLTGSMTATTIGLSEAGSIPGRTLPVTNGSFTDSFDGLAVHIYQIEEEICPQSLCDFTIIQNKI